MNILFILPEYYPHSGGGISTYYLHYIKALKPYCGKIKIIVGSGYVQSDEDHLVDGVEVEYLRKDIHQACLNKFSKFDLIPDFRNNLAAAWAMFQQADEGKDFDIIECTDFGLGFIPWVINNKQPVITRLHGSAGQIRLHEADQPDNMAIDFMRQTELLLLPHCDKIITHSSANQLFWNQLFNNQSVALIDPVFNTDVKTPLPLAEREPFGLVTARIQRWKGPIPLCEALTKLNTTEAPQIKWIGRDMPYEGRQSMSAFLKNKFPAVWDKNVKTQSPLPNEQIQALQKKVKFGVAPSTWDMFNFTCLEFLGAGTPLICSDGAGASDLIDHGKNGFKYRASDPIALADCLRQISGMQEEEYNKMALAGLDTVNQRLSPAKIIPLNLEQYRLAISNFKGKPANTFLEAIYAPSNKQSPIKDILDALPLKRLLSYVARRIKSKTGKN